jgi:transcriptional regulator with PAS, ATPase and Fis domain
MLRVLQEREFERVGGVRTIKTDVRVIAATNRNLKEAVARGTFRDDLYHRLNVVAIAMPALRERCEDIPALARYFIEKHERTAVRKIGGCSEEALACLTAYDWPGNVRELENAIERAIVLGSTELILPDDLPDSVLQSDAPGAANMKFHEMIRQMKRQMIAKALEQANGSYAEAAKSLGLHPNNLHRLMKSLNLKAAR